MGWCIDCNAPLKGYGVTKPIRCKPCHHKSRVGSTVSDIVKQQISLTKQQNLLEKQRSKYIGRVINGITFVELVDRSSSGYYIWKLLCHCGNIFTNKGSRIVTGLAKSCGCSHITHCKELGKKQVGKNNPAWIEDRTTTSLYIRNKDYTRNSKGSWQYFSRKCKIEQNYLCQLTHQKCGSGDLVTHHIESVTIRPDLVIEKDNVIVIRKDIHIMFHKLYGKKTTRDDWNNFVTRFYQVNSINTTNFTKELL